MRLLLCLAVASLLTAGCMSAEVALLNAADRGDVAAMKKLIAGGAGTGAKSEYGWTSLHWAALRGQAEVVKLLLAAGADQDAQDMNGQTPLHYAAKYNHADAFVLLMSRADLHAKDREGATALHLAVRRGNKRVVEVALEAGADVNAKDNEGYTPLDWAGAYGGPDAYGVKEMLEVLRSHGAESGEPYRYDFLEAARRGDTARLKELLAAGANINAMRRDGLTALHLAGRYNHLEVAEVLIAGGADVNIKGCDTPLDCAGRFSSWDVADMLRSHGGKARDINDELEYAAKKGDLAWVKDCVAGGANVNARYFSISTSYTPLHIAVQDGHADIVRFLIAGGADVMADSGFGRTPLHCAAFSHSKKCCEVAKILIASGAKVNARDKGFWGHGKISAMTFLGVRDAFHLAEDVGITPLHNAAGTGNKAMVEFLLAEKADVNARDGGGNTPLHWAVVYDRSEVTGILLAGGAEVNARNCQHLTPLDTAESDEMTRLLRKHGAKTAKELEKGK